MKYNLSILDNRNGSTEYINKINHFDDIRSDIVFNIDNFLESGTYEYLDVKNIAYLSIYEGLSDLCENDIIAWFHELSVHLETKIYIDFDEPEFSPKFGLSWCINGYQRSVVFDMQNDDNDIPYTRYNTVMECKPFHMQSESSN